MVTQAEASGQATHTSAPGTDPGLTPHKPAVGQGSMGKPKTTQPPRDVGTHSQGLS